MSNVQWNRDYLLTFKNPDGVVTQVTGLRMSFAIEYFVDNSKKSNTGRVSVYNFSDETIKKLGNRFGQLTLDVGYTGNIQNILVGDIINIKTEKQGVDKITTFELAPNFRDLSVKKITYNYPRDISLRAVVSDVAKLLGLSFYSSFGDWENIKLPFGYPAYGTGKQILDNIASTYAIEWKINNGALYVTDRYGLVKGKEQAFVLSKETGMIESPWTATEQITENLGAALNDGETIIPHQVKLKKDGTARKYSKQQVLHTGTMVRALINPSVRPNDLFKIISDDTIYNGFYRVRTARFRGDTRGNEWEMELYGDNVIAVELGEGK